MSLSLNLILAGLGGWTAVSVVVGIGVGTWLRRSASGQDGRTVGGPALSGE